MYYVLFKTKNDGFDLLFEMFKLFCFKRNVLLNIYIHVCSYDIYNTVHVCLVVQAIPFGCFITKALVPLLLDFLSKIIHKGWYFCTDIISLQHI